MPWTSVYRLRSKNGARGFSFCGARTDGDTKGSTERPARKIEGDGPGSAGKPGPVDPKLNCHRQFTAISKSPCSPVTCRVPELGCRR